LFADGRFRAGTDALRNGCRWRFEYYPNRHTALRVDAGDTVIQFKPGDSFYQRFDEPIFVRRQWSHNLQITVGFPFRF
jgi:hypothetical protein